MIRIHDVTFMRGVKFLLESASADIQSGQKVGIIGRNGCGKSSLFALIRGLAQVEAGELRVSKTGRIVAVEQEVPSTATPALAYVVAGDREVAGIKASLAAAEAGNKGDDIAHWHEQLAIAGGYDIEARAAAILQGLGFRQAQLGNGVDSFSGGWRMRLNLARALICQSDLLLLDEPTNHLDLDAVIWLEKWLKQYQGTLMLISHDRAFLDSTVSHILSFEQRALFTYKGDYSAFERQKALRLQRQQQEFVKQQAKIAHLQSFINRFKAKASKAKQAQSRVKQLSKLEDVLAVQQDNPFSFEFFQPEKSPNPLIALDKVVVGYDNTPVLHNIQLNLVPGSRIGLLGHNGAGKSTLVKLLVSELRPLAGYCQVSQGVKVGYFAQHQAERLHFDDTPLQHIQRLDRHATEQQLRDYLGGFCFSGDAAVTKIGTMSGGEKARLVLALIIYSKPNLLLLDEPTNHLDLDMRQALTCALQTYPGALLLVSHDRYLLNAVCDDFYLVDSGTVELFKGDLDDYQRWIAETATAACDTAAADASSAQMSRKEQKRLQAKFRQDTKQQRHAIATAEQQMQIYGEKLAELERELTAASLYDEPNKTLLMAKLAAQKDYTQKLSNAESQWLSSQEQLEWAESEFTSKTGLPV